jgi:hypothetical protein
MPTVWAGVEMKQGKRLAARERFAALEKDATSKEFLLVAHAGQQIERVLQAPNRSADSFG